MAALSDPEPALVFVGFMGAGKSTALAAAADAGLETADADDLLEAELGMPIARFFAEHGEAEFRRREEELVAGLLERAGTGDAIALGGGAVASARVQEALRRHAVAWLRVGEEEAWERSAGPDRPLTADRARFSELHAQREPIYASLADAVLGGNRATLERALPALLALRELPGARLAWATSASGQYPAFVGRGLLGMEPLGRAARHGAAGLAGRPFCVTDEAVAGLYGDALEPLAARVEVPPGEEAKTLAEAERVMRELARAGMTRSDHVVALGGGVVGDLAGFCAASYQRGVPVVQVPTTLVAQVDSAYGGKTGVDIPEAKNYVGAYHQPSAVIADTGTLDTLPAAELAAGFAEVVKTALIAGGGLWEQVRGLGDLDPRRLDDVIFACALTKLEVVAADERDAGGRAALNLGHTVGHAIEQATSYGRYRHGEAVGLGLLAALRLSGAGELRDEVAGLLDRHGLPVALDPGVDIDAVIAAVERDKKRDAEGVGFVVCERPGQLRLGARVDADSLRGAVEELQR